MKRLLDTRTAYTLLLWLLLPYALFHLWWRGRKQPEYRQHVGERFGRYAVHSDRPVIWLHTVSVGETRAAATLVRELQERYPGHQILLTHTTPTGRAASEQLYGDSLLRVYLPYDYPFAVRRFLRHFRPRIGILLETEIWPNLIHLCHEQALPLLLLNARLSERSERRYRRFPRLSRTALRELALIAAQTESDAARLTGLGAHDVPVMGNLKFDIVPPPALLQLGRQLRARFGAYRPVLLAASTREGEEELLLDALKGLMPASALVVIVPRHPQRFDEVAALISRLGFIMQRRSTNEPIAPTTQVVLGDSMGEMFAYYAACDLAFIGGSLLPFGAQNLIEASSVGRPVLVGPHTYNFAQATRLALECGAAAQASTAEELVSRVNALLADPQELERMGKAGLRFVGDNQGATERAMAHISRALI